MEEVEVALAVAFLLDRGGLPLAALPLAALSPVPDALSLSEYRPPAFGVLGVFVIVAVAVAVVVVVVVVVVVIRCEEPTHV